MQLVPSLNNILCTFMITSSVGLVKKTDVKTGIANSRSKCQRQLTPQNSSQGFVDSGFEDSVPRLEFRTDYLTLTGRLEVYKNLVEMADFVAGSFDDCFEYRSGKGMTCGRYYANTAISPRGMLLAWGETSSGFGQNKSDSKHIEFRLSIPAKPLRQVDEFFAWSVFKKLRFNWGVKATRFDIACDDFSKSLLIYDEIYGAGASGNYTGFQVFQPVATFNKAKLCGWSLYFGSAQSDKRLVFYDKAAESGGRTDSHRVELRLKEKRSELAFDAYCRLEKTLAVGDSVIWKDCPPHLSDCNPFKIQHFVDGAVVLDWVEKPVLLSSLRADDFTLDSFAQSAVPFLSSLLVANYDFISRFSGNVRASRSERLDWWQSFLSCLTLVDVSLLAPRRPVTVLQNSLDWFARQIAPTAAMVRKVFGIGNYKLWWDSLLADGESRWGKRHEALIQVASAEWYAA